MTINKVGNLGLLFATFLTTSCLQQTVVSAEVTDSSSSANVSSSSASTSSRSSSSSVSSSSSSASPTNLPLGTVRAVSGNCSSLGLNSMANCQTITVTCPNTAGTGNIADIDAYVGSLDPSGTVKGTIFMHAGGDGTNAFNNGYIAGFTGIGYRVVQVKWATAWQDTSVTPRSIKIAACRPATVFKYIYTNIHGGASATGGMCGLGFSGGSGALGFALTRYGASSYLDKAMFFSGPVFPDVEIGCRVPNAPAETICGSGQYGCNGAPWNWYPTFTPNAAALIQTWSGDATCAGSSNTTSASAIKWKEMSIVDNTVDSSYFQYPKTAVSGWLCNNMGNSSAPLGQLYFQHFTGPSQTAAYSVNSVSNCGGVENIWSGTLQSSGADAFQATLDDMSSPTVGCLKRH